MTLEELAQELGEFIAEEIIKPLAPKPLIETREERMKREYAPVVGDCGWYITVQKDATGKRVMGEPVKPSEPDPIKDTYNAWKDGWSFQRKFDTRIKMWAEGE